MEVLVLDGKNYVKASKAAKDLGYATDYVGQLCRTGQVDSHLIGRTWYVNQEELSTHRVEKKRTSRIKAREYAKRTIEEYRKQNEKTQNTYNSVAIQYEKDTESLIPETRKVSIVSEKNLKHFDTYTDEGDEKRVINKGAKVLMEGNLDVVDVTDGDIDDTTTILRPKIFASAPEAPVRKRVVDDIPVTETVEDTKIIDSVPIKKSFIEKLEDKSIYAEEADSVVPEVAQQEVAAPVVALRREPLHNTAAVDTSISITSCLAIIVISIAVVTATLPLSKLITYTKDQVGTVSVNTSIYFSIDEAKQLLLNKI